MTYGKMYIRRNNTSYKLKNNKNNKKMEMMFMLGNWKIEIFTSHSANEAMKESITFMKEISHLCLTKKIISCELNEESNLFEVKVAYLSVN